MSLNLISDWQFCFEVVNFLLSSKQPVFLSRIGGSDTHAVFDYMQVKSSGNVEGLHEVYRRQIPSVEGYNGYYDKDQSPERFFKYCELLWQLYIDADNLFFCNSQLLSLCFRDNINPVFYTEDFYYKSAYLNFLSAAGVEKRTTNCFPYPFVEKIIFDKWTLFRVFAETLKDKKVLVICPFAKSIASNFSRRFEFFKSYKYPDFDLSLYNTPITYCGLPDEFYPDHDWFATTERMKAELSALDFDIALLSCGSYAMPLGAFIANVIRRKAVYVGGVLQLYFGIFGRRYDNPFFLDQINRDKFIYPLEKDAFITHFKVTEQTPTEAFGAYF